MCNLLILLVLLIGYPIKSLVYSELTSSREGCVLPNDLVNSRFCSFECDDCSTGKWIYEPGDTVKHLIKVQCEPGHRMEGDKVSQMVLCLKGQWIPPIPVCNKVCPSLKTFAVNFTCFFGHLPVDCSTSSVLPGTTASYKCKPDFVAEKGTHLVCSPGGLWLGTFPKCVLEKEKLENKLNSLNSVCGRSTKTARTKRVALDQNAELGEYPWIAAITYWNKSGIYNICGGILISDQYVVSTASCVGEIGTPDTYTVRIGDLDLDEAVVDGASPLDLKVESTVIHEQYNRSINTNDIGLIKLQSRVKFNDFIRPICLPPPDEFSEKSFEEYPVDLAAWGSADYDSGVKLRRKKVKMISLEDCKLNYTSVTGSKVDEDIICTWHLEKDTCQVPAGAPLMVSQDSRIFLLGITSFGVLCSNGKYPEINVRVSRYIPWIVGHMDFK